MDWLTFLSSIISSLAWPLAVICIVFMLRKQLQHILVTLRQVKFKDLEANFGQEIKELEEKADKGNLPPAEAPILPAPTTKALPLSEQPELTPPSPATGESSDIDKAAIEQALQHYSQALALSAPRVAVLEQWAILEKEARSAAKRASNNNALVAKSLDANTPALIGVLAALGYVPKEVDEITLGLRKLRNSVAHDRDTIVTPEQAVEYIRLSQRVIAALHQVEPSSD